MSLSQRFAALIIAGSVLAAPAAEAILLSSDRMRPPATARVSATLESPATIGGVRYIRASSRAEALALFAVKPEALIEAPGNMSAARYGPCRLIPHAVHTRRSGNWGIVGAKPETECGNVRVSVIRHETTLRYSWYIWWLQAGNVHVETATKSTRFQSLGNAYKCRGREMTTWTGTTLGTIVFHGRKYYALVYHGLRDLACAA